MEHSDATVENTRWVEVWIVNDGDYFAQAVRAAEQGPDELGEYLTDVLKSAREGTGAWHMARELSANDYNRIDWEDLANTLLAY